MQVADQRTDAIGRSVLRVLDLGEELPHIPEPSRLEMSPRHVDLDGESEEELRQVVVEVRGDLHALVLAFLCHTIRECAQHMLAILKLLVRLLQCLAAEEHLASEEQRDDEYGYGPKIIGEIHMSKEQAEEGESQITNKEFAQSPDTHLTNHTNW